MAGFNISFAGAGKVAGTLCTELFTTGHKIIQISSKGNQRGKALAKSVNAIWSDELVFTADNDIVIISVPDSQLREVLTNIKCNTDTYLIHTAGSYGLEVFPENIRNKGVFYPLQTFTADRKVNFKDIPVILESDNEKVKSVMSELAGSLGSPVHFIDAEKRRILHLAAVFASNFTNFMLTNAKDITGRAGLDYNLLEPLVKETVSRAFESDPAASQTGPAVRNDLNTIELHAKLLDSTPEIKELYLQLTGSIIKYYKREPNG